MLAEEWRRDPAGREHEEVRVLIYCNSMAFEY
jgi:hypothetical protein